MMRRLRPPSPQPRPSNTDAPSGSLSRKFFYGASLCIVGAAVIAACGASGGQDAADAEQASASTAAPVEAPEPGEPSAASDGAVDGAADEAVEPEPVSETATNHSGISFASDIQPIISNTCARCHTGDGPGTQHVRFDSADKVARVSFAIANVVESGFMPPWPSSDLSVPFDHDWSLSNDEIDVLLAWDDAGSPLDVPDDTAITPVDGLIGLQDPDITMQSQGAYDGEIGQDDTYRCLIYDPQLESSAFAQSIEFKPQQTQVVHHAVTFLVSEEDRAALEAKSGADGQGGWTCNGFSPAPSSEIVFTWAPGQPPTRFEEGTGLEVQAGDFFVSQTHYHFDVEAPADQSEMAIDWAVGADIQGVEFEPFFAPAEIPCSAGETGPLCDRDAARERAVERFGQEGVLADAFLGVCGYTVDDFALMTDGIASSKCVRPVSTFGEIVSVYGHQHELGTSIRVTLNPDTPDALVLLDIPRWDFNWQLIYEPTDSIVLQEGDTVGIECTWDRSLRDPSLEPSYVLWSEGTNDEMCYGSFMIRP